MRLLDAGPAAFDRCFTAWMSALVEASGGRPVAIDGKTIRRSFTHAWDASGATHLVSDFVCAGENRVAFAQVPCVPAQPANPPRSCAARWGRPAAAGSLTT